MIVQVLELGILRTLRDACFEQKRPVSLALNAFPAAFQSSLDQYMNKRFLPSLAQSLLIKNPGSTKIRNLIRVVIAIAGELH